MSNLKLIKDLRQKANYLQASCPNSTAASNLMNQAAEEIEELRKLYDDPQWDATDGAHPAWWRGEKWSAYKAAELIANIFSNKETGKGVMNEPLETMRRSVMDLKQKYETLQEQNKKQAGSIGKYQAGTELENLRHQLNEQYIEKGEVQNEFKILNTKLNKVKKERDKLQYELDVMEVAYKSCFNDGQAKEIEKQDKQIEKLQTKLDQRTKCENGVSMKCGHSAQWAYTTRIDSDNGCSICNIIKERDKIKTERENCFIMLNEAQLPICGGSTLDGAMKRIIRKFKEIQKERDKLRNEVGRLAAIITDEIDAPLVEELRNEIERLKV